LSPHAWGAGQATSPPPTYANFAYGAHPRNVLDFWKAESPAPTPLVIFIHGGGFQSFSKERIRPRDVRQLLANGISVAAINYRYVQTDPLPACFFDARRAVQFLRSKALDWNIDKTRVGAYGGSAGAMISMWLAFHDDMAVPNSDDPVTRESTRLACVATQGGQITFARHRVLPALPRKGDHNIRRLLIFSWRNWQRRLARASSPLPVYKLAMRQRHGDGKQRSRKQSRPTTRTATRTARRITIRVPR